MTCHGITHEVIIPYSVGMDQTACHDTIETSVGTSAFFHVPTNDTTVLPPETLMGNVSEQASSSHLRRMVEKTKEEEV